jgi:hypothetical protein
MGVRGPDAALDETISRADEAGFSQNQILA